MPHALLRELLILHAARFDGDAALLDLFAKGLDLAIHIGLELPALRGRRYAKLHHYPIFVSLGGPHSMRKNSSKLSF